MVDFISRKLAKYHRTREGSSRTVRVYGGSTEVSCNESIYLRVVGFRESMHDDATSHPPPILRLTPLFLTWLVSSNDL